jgi:hypothetical protein
MVLSFSVTPRLINMGPKMCAHLLMDLLKKKKIIKLLFKVIFSKIIRLELPSYLVMLNSEG